MYRTIILIALLLSFSLCYMEWGGGQSSTIGQLQWKILVEDRSLGAVWSHPLILGGLLGQVILLVSAFYARMPRWVTYLGMLSLGAVVVLILLAGLLTFNYRILFSVLPFLFLAILYVRMSLRKSAPNSVN